uniref:LRR receptor-like serine/threonine-protein kinase At5g45840 family n=2 Tax=Cajanus cajan TaxID=3821 RepID=A0A151S6E3_CAJCA|nr:putative LRR receptor-like serine/threonine-protein kinase At5g45840 family [Cajanus cajan]
MRWKTFGFCLRIYICLISVSGIQECWSLNDEGLNLLEFRARITYDPYNALANWNPNDCDPCEWFGVHCLDGKVKKLELKELSLEGTLAPELGKLSHLNSLVLCKNNFSGVIPKELGDLSKLELLDLRENNLLGSIPVEIGKMPLLKHLLLCNSKIGGSDTQDGGKFKFPSKSLLVENCSSPLKYLFACINRKVGHCVWQGNFKQWNKSDSLIILTKVALMKCLNAIALPLLKLRKPALHGHEKDYCDLLPSSNVPEIAENVPEFVSYARRRLLQSSGSNLVAAPFSGESTIELSSVPITLSSGSFPAVQDDNKKQNQSPESLHSPSDSPYDQTSQQHTTNDSSGTLWKYIIIIVVVLIIILIILLYIWRKPAVKVITPWKTGISGQLQKAFITGAPKLNRVELETACEDFSNIVISGFEGCNIYKGTLSSGVEIAVVSTLITSSQDWSKDMEMNYRKKIDTLSRINHKNFINLIGYCEEEEPFTRMLVYEYAPNGNVFEHLHVKEMERLNWSERVRIIMGIAYCLQYMHHDLNPPVALANLTSSMIFLTDDFAAKVAEVTFKNIEAPVKLKSESKKSEVSFQDELKNTINDFGMLLLEIISGKLPYSEEQGNLVAEYLSDKRSINYMIDPTLESFKENELDAICEVIQDCIQPDPKLRPEMRDVTSKLRETLGISPEQAVPRLSPLWWAELEILSVEAT